MPYGDCGRKNNLMQSQKSFTTGDTENTEKTEKSKMIERQAEALVRRIGEACDELEKLAEENPELVGRVTHGAEEHKEAYLRLKARLALADEAPRCRWVRQDGTTCGSPQMRRHIYCFAHRQMAEAQALALRLPALEDANAIQVGLMRIQKALIEGTISTKQAGLLLYSMQLALQNVGRTTFGQVKAQEPVVDTVDEEEALSKEQDRLPKGPRSASGSLDADTPSGPVSKLTNSAENTEDAKEGKTLPRMNADERRSEEVRRPVEWRPSADMYRMDTREGMEAYEAWFRMKIAPPRAVVSQEQSHPHEVAECRADLG